MIMNNTNLFGDEIKPAKENDIQRPLEQLVSPLTQTFNEDCMVVMARYPDKYFDLACVDVPYGIGVNKEKPHNGWADWGIKEWDNKAPEKEYFTEIMRVSQNQIIWGANHFIDKIALPRACWIIWDKGQRDFSLADAELAWTSFNTAVRVFDYSRAKALQEGKIHPTQKPVALYDWIFKNYAERGQKILDTHLGSGSSRIAAYKAGLDFTGCELDKDYFEAQEARFKIFVAQQTLF
jgi:site-specific DNA-methyltransferase (adenine-specific)